MADDYLGQGGRLEGGPAPELVRAAFAAETAHGPRLARWLSFADIAHAVELAECGAVDGPTAAALMGGLLELHEIPPERFPWDPTLGDAFNSREAELRRRVGAGAAGWLSAGRPRREAFRVGLRLLARAGALALHHRVLGLAEALARQAERHLDDLTADYTYLLPAQPTTLGHLLLSYAEPVLRDAERLRGAHVRLDESVAGAGGSAGSRWPIDRERLAAHHGASGVVRNARDAAWQADAYLELIGAIAIHAAHVSQLAQDLEILASMEFGVVELADGHSRASALMPQKRNPYALAILRAWAATAAGEHAGALTALHTGSARTDHFHVLNGLVPRLLEESAANSELSGAVVAGLRFDVAAAARVTHDGFIVAADVADMLAMTTALDYRSAHKAVGLAVRRRVEAGVGLGTLTPDLLAEACRDALGVEVVVSDADLASALDVRGALATRTQRGGAAPARVSELLDAVRAQIRAERAWDQGVAERATLAEVALLDRAARLAAG